MDYYIDFQGYCRIKGNSIEDAREIFYDCFGDNEVQELNLDMLRIEEVEDEE